MRSFLRSLLAVLALGGTMSGCDKPEAAAAPTDVTLNVPAMN
jgi:hypothetical protein